MLAEITRSYAVTKEAALWKNRLDSIDRSIGYKYFIKNAVSQKVKFKDEHPKTIYIVLLVNP